MKRIYVIYSAMNERYETDNLAKFCRDRGLNYQCMLGLFAGRGRTHKGWVPGYSRAGTRKIYQFF